MSNAELHGYFAYWDDKDFPTNQYERAGYLVAAHEVMTGEYVIPIVYSGLGFVFHS